MMRSWSAFEPTSKRRRGYPSETRVRRDLRVVHGQKELLEQLGRNAVALAGAFKRCCLGAGRYDDALRDDYFRE